MTRGEELVLSAGVILLFAVLAVVGLVHWWVPAGIVAIRLTRSGYQAVRG